MTTTVTRERKLFKQNKFGRRVFLFGLFLGYIAGGVSIFFVVYYRDTVFDHGELVGSPAFVVAVCTVSVLAVYVLVYKTTLWARRMVKKVNALQAGTTERTSPGSTEPDSLFAPPEPAALPASSAPDVDLASLPAPPAAAPASTPVVPKPRPAPPRTSPARPSSGIPTARPRRATDLADDDDGPEVDSWVSATPAS